MCPDGAVHTALGKSNNSIITYLVTIVSHYIIKALKMFPSSANNIFVHCQIHGKETLANLKSLMTYRFKYENKKNLPVRDLGDGKHLYQLTQHSSWNRLCYPMLLCGCVRGATALADHECQMWTDTEYQSYMQKSKEQWDNRAKLTEIHARNRMKEYNLATHRNWVDQKNMGISHFGAIPMDYIISNIRIDIFHGRKNVYKVCLTYI